MSATQTATATMASPNCKVKDSMGRIVYDPRCDTPMKPSIPLKENMVILTTSSNKMHEALESVLKFGTVFLTYRVLQHYTNEDPDVPLFDTETLVYAILILLGFVLYYLLIAPLLPTNYQYPVIGQIINDTLMFGTALLLSNVVGSWIMGTEMFSTQWMKTSLYILLGLATYRVLIEPFIPQNLNPNIQPMINDWALYGTAFVITMLLSGTGVNGTLVMSTLFVLIGFAGYDLIVKNIINVQ